MSTPSRVSRERKKKEKKRRREEMYEPSIRRKSLQYSCDVCGEIPILRKRWCCDVCEDYDVCDNCHQTQKERLLKKTTNKKMKERDGEKAMLTSDSEEDTDSEDEEDEENDMHRDSHSMRAYAVTETMEPLHSGKLSAVAEDACCRWFMDALKQAKRGDPNQAALVSQMMLEGYGCNADPKEARYWAHVARNAGARRIEGVYDELP